MSLYRETALVLRTQKLGEADRVVTLLTHSSGRVRASARGARRTKSRLGARLEPFMHIDIQLFRGRTLDVVTQVETIDAFAGPLGADYSRYTVGTAMVEVCERLTPVEQDPVPALYRLLVGAIRALAQRERPAGLLLDAFLLRAMAVSGWALSCRDCAVCGDVGPHRGFAVSGGGAVCGQCRGPGSTAPQAGTVELMAALLTGDWQRVQASTERQRKEASGLVAASLQWHLEHGVRSFRHVER